MKLSKLALLGIACLGIQSAEAKTAAELKAAFATIMPASGLKARMAWAQGGTLPDTLADRTLYAVDGDEGVVRRILPTTMSVDVDWPNVTADGSKIVFADLKSYSAYVVNFDGTGLTKLAVDIPTDELTLEYWVDASGVDWIIAGGGDCGTIRRFKLSDPKVCVSLWNKTGNPSPSHGDGLGLSQDGTRLCAMWDRGRNDASGMSYGSGIGVVPDGQVSMTPLWIGCGISMLPDNSYTAGIGNKDIRVVDGAGNIKVKYDVNKAVMDYAKAHNGANNCNGTYEEFINFRWSNKLDVISFGSYWTKANPWIYNVKTGKFISIVDDMGCTKVEHSDLMFYTGTSVVSQPALGVAFEKSQFNSDNPIYSLNGRRLAPHDISKQNASGAMSIRIMKQHNTRGMQKVLVSQ